jgi:23S rRNA (adenine2503-C2)-methyltransferase
LNPTGGYDGRSPDRTRLRALADRLARHGVHATVRRTRGTDIDAACGQLRARTIPVTPSPSTTMAP